MLLLLLGAAMLPAASGNAAEVHRVWHVRLRPSPRAGRRLGHHTVDIRDFLSTGLGVPAMEVLDERQQDRQGRLARLRAPGAVAAVRRSERAFRALGPRAADNVDRQTFPSIVRPGDEAPKLRAGQRVLRYRSPFLAETQLAGNRRGLVASLAPMAAEAQHGAYAPLDLSLHEAAGGFEPRRTAAPVRLPANLDEGVRASLAGVTITPVGRSGTPIDDRGEANTASVVYPDAAIDTDAVVQPTSTGFEISAILRSPDSPTTLRYRVQGPSGLELQQHGTGQPVEVLEDGTRVGEISPPSATDANHNPVPVSVALRGETLLVTVEPTEGQTQWPIDVDPNWYYVNDTNLPVYGGAPTNWVEYHSPGVGISYGPTPGAWVWASSSNGGEYGGLQYEAKGDTRIYYAEDESSASLEPTGSDTLEQFVNPGHANNYAYMSLGANYTNFTDYLCAQNIYPCYPEYGYNDNLFQMTAIAGINAIGRSWWFSIQRAKLYMAEENGTEAFFNTTGPTIPSAGGRHNLLYGDASTWMTPNAGAFEIQAHNPGMGLAYVAVEELEGGSFKAVDDNHANGDCHGEQCPTEDLKSFTYSEALANGEDTLRLVAWGSDNSYVEQTKTIKVDGQPPEAPEVTGWPQAREIGPVPATLTISAKDGTAPTRSSGVKSLTVSIDGRKPQVLPEASCAPGPCTAQGTYTLSTGSLSEGVHRLVVTATDNAGNEAAPRVFFFDVRRATPIAVGPGAVEPTTGQFELSATDASVSAGTAITRTYKSREIGGPSSGPLGPQWSLSLGGSESLRVLPGDEITLSAADRGRTTFKPKSAYEFEAPKGDGNLKLTAKEASPGHGITEYVMSDSRTGTSISYTQPSGTQETAPLYEQQFGAEGLTMTPASAATDKAGDVWVTDAANSRLLEFNEAGELLRQAGSYGGGSGAMREPAGIAINEASGNIYVGDAGNHRIDEFNEQGQFIQAFGIFPQHQQGFGTCTSACEPGAAPTNAPAGAVDDPTALAVDGSGNVWVADAGYNRLLEMGANGAVSTLGGYGSGPAQFNEPTGIAIAAGDVFVSEGRNARVQVLTPGGTFVREFGQKGSGAGELGHPSGIAADPSGRLYVVDSSSERVLEYTQEGALITTFGSQEAEGGQLTTPDGIAISAKGEIDVTDKGSDVVSMWARDRWLPTKNEGPVRTAAGSSNYGLVTFEPGRSELLPQELLGPTPPTVSCGTTPAELKNGCRALILNFTKQSGTASGEQPAAWGTYKGRLESVEFEATNPTTGKLEATTVAKYSYDGHGRLRAEWDPRVTPELKTEYGYDEEGHVTSLTPPGQQSWEFTYGTTAGDAASGRLLKVSRGPANSEVWNGEAPSNTAGPAILGTAAVGSSLSMSAGTWNNEHSEVLAFGYQWQRCNESGGECAPIAGAVNATYTPVVADAKHKLVATVFATNGGGTRKALAAATAVVSGAAFTLSQNIGKAGSGAQEFSEPTSVAVAPTGVVWVADGSNHRLEELTAEGHFIAAVGWGVSDGKEEFERCTAGCRAGLTGGGAGEFADPEGIAVNQQNGRLYVADAAENRVDVLTSTGAPLSTFSYYGDEHLEQPHGLAVAANGTVWVADTNHSRVVEFGPEGEYVTTLGTEGKGRGEFEGVMGVAVVGGDVYATDVENMKVKEFEIATHQLVREFGESGSGKGQFEYPWPIAYDPVSEQLLVGSYGDGRIESYSLTGTPGEEFGHQGSGSTALDAPAGVAVNASTGAAYIADEGNNRIDEWSPGGVTSEPAPPAPAGSRGSVFTIDYNVPTSGPGIEHPLTEGEVKRWGQRDMPVEGTAIFPPDKPMGWPAASYEGATIEYLDSRSLPVNSISRLGGISTTEFNEANEVTRTLSPAALDEALGQSEPAAAAALLSIEDKYNEEGQVTETLGPQHKTKVAHGKSGAPEEMLTRLRTKSSYDSTYGLLTREESAAVNGAGEEFDKRTTTDSYEGQYGVGWRVRKPTSVTTDAGGVNSTLTTEYDETSGQITAVRGPGSSKNEAPLYRRTLAEGGTLNDPRGVVADYSGNIWVADSANRRIDEFSATGTFIQAVGWGVKQGEEKLEVCTSSCKQGIYEPESLKRGQFVRPTGVTWDAVTDALYIADPGHQDIDELTFKKGRPKIKAFGTYGSGKNQYNDPESLTGMTNGNIWVADRGNHRLVEISDKGKYLLSAAEGKGAEYVDVASCGATGTGTVYAVNAATHRVDVVAAEAGGAVRKSIGGPTGEAGSLLRPAGIACDPASSQLYVSDEQADRVDIYSTAGIFSGAFGIEGGGPGELRGPAGIAFNSAGAAYVADSANNRISEWAPSADGARKTITAYYTAENESPVAACRKHPEWANLTCRTEPAEQSGASNTPALPVVTTTYNIYDEPERVTEEYGGVTRTKTTRYDSAGRVTASEVTGGSGEPTPSVSDSYNRTTGQLESLASGSETQVTHYNSVGEIESYSDGSGGESTFEYEQGGAERLIRFTDGKGEQKYTYDSRSGLRTKLEDSGLGTVTATYDVEGRITSETLPDKLVEHWEYDETGATSAIKYEKTAGCAGTCPEIWYSASQVQGSHGETMVERSTLGEDKYRYDTAGRIVEASEQPVAGGCRAREYHYSEGGYRNEEVTREGTGASCPTEGGSPLTHAYDSAGYLADVGVQYDAFGDIVRVPERDSEGHALTSSYYVDGAVASTTENGQTISYSYDAIGREKKVRTTGTQSSEAIQHYATGEAETTSWTDEGSKWTRNVPGLGGELLALQPSSGSVAIQLHDLRGDVVATAGVAESEHKLLSTFTTTEFGAPVGGDTPPRYSWLAEAGASSQYSHGVGVDTSGGAAYVPQLARNLQTAAIEAPGSCPTGCGHEQPRVPTLNMAGVEATEVLARQIVAEEEAARQKALEEQGVDPIYSVMLTAKQAEIVATILRHGPTALEALAKAEKVPGIGAFFADRLAEIGKEYLQGVAYGLELCYTAIRGSSGVEARCRLWVDDWIPEKNVYWFTAFGVETCWGKKYNKAHSWKWTFPLSQCAPTMSGEK